MFFLKKKAHQSGLFYVLVIMVRQEHYMTTVCASEPLLPLAIHHSSIQFVC